MRKRAASVCLAAARVATTTRAARRAPRPGPDGPRATRDRLASVGRGAAASREPRRLLRERFIRLNAMRATMRLRRHHQGATSRRGRAGGREGAREGRRTERPSRSELAAARARAGSPACGARGVPTRSRPLCAVEAGLEARVTRLERGKPTVRSTASDRAVPRSVGLFRRRCRPRLLVRSSCGRSPAGRPSPRAMASGESPAGIPLGVEIPLDLADGFDDAHGDRYMTLRYDFLPASVRDDGQGSLRVDAKTGAVRAQSSGEERGGVGEEWGGQSGAERFGVLLLCPRYGRDIYLHRYGFRCGCPGACRCG